MFELCREGAGSEPAAGVTDIAHDPEPGVQSCQGPQFTLCGEVRHVSGSVPEMAATDL